MNVDIIINPEKIRVKILVDLVSSFVICDAVLVIVVDCCAAWGCVVLLEGISSTDESLCKNDMLVESSDNTDVICVLRMLQMKPYRYKLIRDAVS